MSDQTRAVLVFGAHGQIGRELMQRSPAQRFALIGLTHADIDIADEKAVRDTVRRHRPDIVVNAAAYTAVDKAETDADLAFAVNEAGPRNLGSAADDMGTVVVHLSTDYVFDGRKTDPYVEDDPVAPVSTYGRSKEAGERALREATDRHVILRTSWVYASHGANFLRTMVRLASERDVIGVVADQHGTPTSAADLADAILALLPRLQNKNTAFGTFHLTNAGQTTWHGFAQAIFAGLSQRRSRVPHLRAITTADYPTPAARPAMSVLDCRKIASAYSIRLPPWQDAVSRTLNALVERETHRGAG
jgi:dTDP-4-dehydrorhamnose reductase